VSTADDLLTFGGMLLAGGSWAGRRILPAGLVEEMTTNQLTPEQLAVSGPSFDGSEGWGFGVGVQLTATPGMAVGSYGWAGGLGTVWGNDPAAGVVAILLTNQMWTSPVPPPVFQDFWSSL
jgi:CubicO group peptidase (beta-lactamase class C family)